MLKGPIPVPASLPVVYRICELNRSSLRQSIPYSCIQPEGVLPAIWEEPMANTEAAIAKKFMNVLLVQNWCKQEGQIDLQHDHVFH